MSSKIKIINTYQRKNLVILLLTSLIALIIYIGQKPLLPNQIQPEKKVQRWDPSSKNLLTGEYFLIEDSNVAPLINDNQNIFFLETSEPKSRVLTLSTRQVCAIESAATQNPNSQIFVFLSKIIGLASTPENIALWEVIESLPNVQIKLIDSAEFTKNTPVEHIFSNGINSKQEWRVYHISDVLRYTLLWKFPGTYLDLDVISMKPLAGLGTNFVIDQSSNLTTKTIHSGAGAINFDKDETGRKIANDIMDFLAEKFDGTKYWDLSSVGVLSRMIEKLCDTKNLMEMTPYRCEGFKVYSAKLLYALRWGLWGHFFKENLYEETMKMLNGSIGCHLWNDASHGTRVNRTQRVALNELAKTYCPKTFATPGEYF